ncbi:MAG: hypothetical protein LBR39_04635 [Coriobacteriales bacterium]|nr:hypothetical protein [Coriobacteriales bacterium]
MALLLGAVFGLIAGAVGISPLLLARHLARKGPAALREQAIAVGLGLVLISLVFLLVVLVVASRLLPDGFIAFGGATVLAFLAGSGYIAYGELSRKS